MANRRFSADQMLKCHRTVGKAMAGSWKKSSRFLSSCGGGRVPCSIQSSESFLRRLAVTNLIDGGKEFRKAAIIFPTRRHFCGHQVKEERVAGPEDTPVSVKDTPFPSSSPYIMIPPSEAAGIKVNDCNTVGGDAEDYYHFFSLKEKKVVRIKKHRRLPWQREFYSPDDSWCVGSSHGWLAFIDRRDCSLFLFNPFFTASFPFIPLPSIETLLSSLVGVRVHKSGHSSSSSFLSNNFILGKKDETKMSAEVLSESCIQKLVLSSPPASSNCTVMVVLGSQMAFCKPGDTTWTELHAGSLKPLACYEEVIYSEKEQLFYVFGRGESIFEAWDLSDPSSPKFTLHEPSFCRRELKSCEQIMEDYLYSFSEQKYLVESSGNLLLVVRFISEKVNTETGTPIPEDYPDDEHLFDSEQMDNCNVDPKDEPQNLYRTFRFHVYKLDFVRNEWGPVDSLGDQALFLGTNQSFSLSARDFPELDANSIYFTDDTHAFTRDISWFCGGHDLGVYNFENGHIKLCFWSPSSTWKIQPSPIWLVPNSS